MFFHKLFATSLGIGYIGKGGGTVAALACCTCWYFAWVHSYQLNPSIIITLLIITTGVWSSGVVEKIWGKDPSKVVIDEVAGMCITLLFVPVTVKYLIIGLILFRFFDIAKPLFIRRVELLPGGWGIMFDDILAGVYANMILQLVIFFRIL